LLITISKRRELQVMHAVALAAHDVLVRAGDRRVEVVVVRVVGAHLDRLVHGAAQDGRERIGVLDEGFQAGAREAREITVSLRARQRVGGAALDDLSCVTQAIEQLVPRGSVDDALRGAVLL
jgi:hypothetical protein